MFYDDDIPIFFSDFAEPAFIDTNQISIIFDNAQIIKDNGYTQVIGYQPQCDIRNTDIDLYDIKEGALIDIRNTAYEVASVVDEGYGTSKVALEKQ